MSVNILSSASFFSKKPYNVHEIHYQEVNVKKLSFPQILRRISLGFFLVLVTTLTILHQKIPSLPSIDALCPFGGLEGLYQWVASGGILQRLQPSSFVLLLATAILGVVLARFFCGWICALGALQGVFGWLGRKVFKKRPTIPAKVDKYLRLLKYVVLVVVLFLTWRAGSLIIRPYDPFAAYGHLSAGWEELWGEFAVGFVILVGSLGLSFVYERFFCKYLCPLGAFLALISRISPFRIKRDNTTCIHCSLCDKSCPMNIDVQHPDVVRSPECINCQECVTVCPTKKSTLFNTWAGKRLSPLLVAIIGLVIYATTVGIAYFTGNARFTEVSLTEQASQGILTPDNIKGSHTLAEVIKAFGIEEKSLYEALQFSREKVPPETRIKDIGDLIGNPDFETEFVREEVRKLLGITNTTNTTVSSAPSPTPTPKPVEKTQTQPSSLVVPEGFFLEGTMSIQDIARALSTTPEVIVKKLGLPADIPTDKPLRDMKDTYGYTIPQLRDKLSQK